MNIRKQWNAALSHMLSILFAPQGLIIMECLIRFLNQGVTYKSTTDVRVYTWRGADEMTIRGKHFKFWGGLVALMASLSRWQAFFLNTTFPWFLLPLQMSNWASSKASPWWQFECGWKGVQQSASRGSSGFLYQKLCTEGLLRCHAREHMYIPLEWTEDINAIAYYSIRNATAHMHRMFLT